MRRALEYEIPRQIEVLKERRQADSIHAPLGRRAGLTEEMRTKEHAHDYRYFPDPDLMPFEPTEAWLAEVKIARVVELPLARKQRFMRDYNLPAGDAEVFKNDVPLGNYFEGSPGAGEIPKPVANWIINNLRAKLAEADAADASSTATPSPSVQTEGLASRSIRALTTLRFPPEALLELVTLIEAKTISRPIAQQVFSEMFDTGAMPGSIVEKHGWAQVSDSAALEQFCDQAIAAHPGPAADFRAGKTAALNFLKGQVMKLSKGKANPAAVGEILQRKLAAVEQTRG